MAYQNLISIWIMDLNGLNMDLISNPSGPTALEYGTIPGILENTSNGVV